MYLEDSSWQMYSASGSQPIHFTLNEVGEVVAIAGAQVLGYEPTQLLGQPIGAVFQTQDHERLQAHLIQPPHEPVRVGEFCLLHADGSELQMQVTFQPLYNSTRSRTVLVSCTPISAFVPIELAYLIEVQRLNVHLERQVNKQLAQLQLASEFEATLKRITDRVRDSLDEDQILQTAVRELATATRASSCNAALYDVVHRTSTVRYEYTRSLLPLQGRVVQMDNFAIGYAQLLQGYYFQFCSLIPNPDRGRVSMLACPILDDQDVLGDLWLVSHECHAFNDQDIRLVQQVANQCAIALRQASLYQAAQAQVRELEKLNRLKDDFLSTVSHELRTPLSNIKLSAQMLELTLQRLGLLGEPASSLVKYLRILNDECDRETNLINDLLDLSRLEAGNEPLEFSQIDLAEWLPARIAPFQERALKQQQHLQIQQSGELTPIVTDTSQLERIVGELLNNACKYTPAGGSITVAAQLLYTFGAELPQFFQISISNTGVEIAPEELVRVFDKFYRIPNNDPWRHGGTGLGLALVRKLAEALGGSISVQSDATATCFTVELPIATQRQDEAMQAGDAPKEVGREL